MLIPNSEAPGGLRCKQISAATRVRGMRNADQRCLDSALRMPHTGFGQNATNGSVKTLLTRTPFNCPGTEARDVAVRST